MFFNLQLTLNTLFFTARFISKYFKGIGEEFLKIAKMPLKHNFTISFIIFCFH